MSAFQQFFCVFISICVVKCQEPERFYFFGFDEQPLDWIENNGTLYLDDVNCHDPIRWTTSSGCPRYRSIVDTDAKCVHLFADTDISRVISTVGYHSMYLKIDVNPWQVEANEWCYIQYRTASTAWINTNIINGLDDSITFNLSIPDTIHYNNQSSFELKIGIQSNGCGDSCLYDHLELFGIPYTQNPTIDPTNAPTFHPTETTNAPTFNPTETTNEPSSSPTVSPTKYPTITPTFDLTSDPTFDPTFDPTSDPTFMPFVSTYDVYTSDATIDVITHGSNSSNAQFALILMVALAVLIVFVLVFIIIVSIKTLRLKQQKKLNKAVKRIKPQRENIVSRADDALQREELNQLPQVLEMTDEGMGGIPEKDMNEVHATTKGNELDEEMNNVNIADDEFIIEEEAYITNGVQLQAGDAKKNKYDIDIDGNESVTEAQNEGKVVAFIQDEGNMDSSYNKTGNKWIVNGDHDDMVQTAK